MKLSRLTVYSRDDLNAHQSHSRAITIATAATLAILTLIFFGRQFIRFTGIRRFGADDVFITLATLFAIGLSITNFILAANDLGDSELLTLDRAYVLMKTYYASQLLYISSLGFAKVSLVAFFFSIHIDRSLRRFVLSLGIFIAIWTLASLVAAALQCSFPQPWAVFSLRCYNTGVFWIIYCIIDMTTDVALVMLSVNLVAYVRVELWRKAVVVACFAPRIFVIGTSILRLVYLYPVTPHDDPALNLWIPVIATQVQVALSIITACIPFLKRIFDGTDHGRRNATFKANRSTNSESYGCCSTAGLRNDRKGQQPSLESISRLTPTFAGTPAQTPQIPSFPLLSPLTTPRWEAFPRRSASSARSPGSRGLYLHIPQMATPRSTHAEVGTPRTASSFALSQNCLSPFVGDSCRVASPVLPLPVQSPTRALVDQTERYEGDQQTQTPRFFLFPPPREARYSLLPQPYSPGRTARLTPISEGSRSANRSPMVPPSRRWSPTPVQRPSRQENSQQITVPLQHPPRSSSLRRFAHNDPLRENVRSPTKTTMLVRTYDEHNETQIPVPSPSLTTGSGRLSSIMSPSRAASPQPERSPVKLPSSPSHLPTFAPIPPLKSPHRMRNQRVLSPQNSFRRHEMSPISPLSPSGRFL